MLVHDQHTGQGVGAIHQRGGTLEYLDGMNSLRVNLYAMLIAPLLSLLADAIVDNDDTVIAQSAYDRLGDTATRGNLADARLTGYSIDDVGRGDLQQLA